MSDSDLRGFAGVKSNEHDCGRNAKRVPIASVRMGMVGSCKEILHGNSESTILKIAQKNINRENPPEGNSFKDRK